MPFKRIVIVGATSAIAVHCARLWVQAGCEELFLVGRNVEKLARVSADLQVRDAALKLHVLTADFLDPLLIEKAVDGIMQTGPVDLVLIAQGALPEQQACQESLVLCRDTLLINAVSPALYAEAFAKYLEKQGTGTLALIGSVAGDRGRRAAYVYGAGKALLAHYIAGLQHRFANTKVKIILIKPGPTETPMTAHLHRAFAPVSAVAADMVAGIQRGTPVIYAPRRWQLIMWIVRGIPTVIFNRLNL